MGPTAKVRLIFWPALTALVVTLVLRLAENNSPLGGLVDRSVVQSRHLIDSAVTSSALARPWALSDGPLREGTSREAVPDDARNHDRDRGRSARSAKTDPPLPDAYTRKAPRASLRAPVMDPRDDVAVPQDAGREKPGSYLVGFVLEKTSPVEDVASPEPSRQPTVLTRTRFELSPGQWPATPALDNQLRELPEQASEWATAVRQELVRLQAASAIASPASKEILKRLGRLVDSGIEQAEQAGSRVVQRDWLRAAHALQRRTAVWTAVWSAAGDPPTRLVSFSTADVDAVRDQLQRVRSSVAETEDPDGWSRFLLIDQLHRALDASPADRQLAAHRFLSRLDWHLLTPAQRSWLENDAVLVLASHVRGWAARPIDYAAMLRQLEWQETHAHGPQDPSLAGIVQSLRHSPGVAGEVAARVNDYYRNANLRLAISDEFLQRMLPSPEPQQRPVRSRVLNADVHGTSHTETQLALQLVPDHQAWRLRLQGTGTVESATRSQRGPVALYNRGRARFEAVTDIAIHRYGAEIAAADVRVAADDSLQRIVTDYDSVPVLGPLVRSIALNGYNQNRNAARQISQRLIREQVATETERTLREQLDRAEATVSRRMLGPLSQLSLQPLVVDLETTQDRLAVRYRIASPWQLASQSPRPRAPRDSLMSLQIHQSALNNLLSRLAPTEAPVSFSDIAQTVVDTFNLPARTIDRELRDDVKIQFAAKDPVTVSLENDRATVTMKVVQMARDGNDGLRYFVVKADYVIAVRNRLPQLERTGVLEIAGPRLGMADRVAIRAVFNAILSNDAPIPLVDSAWMLDPRMADTQVTQVEIRDGWLGIALGPATSQSSPSIAAVDGLLSR